MIHHAELDLRRVSANEASLHGRDEIVVAVPDVLLIQEDEKSLVLGEDQMRRRRLSGKHRKHCGRANEGIFMLLVSLGVQLRRVHDETASLTANVNEYKVRLKNSRKKVHRVELNVIGLLP